LSDNPETKDAYVVVPDIVDSGSAGTQGNSSQSLVPEIINAPYSIGNFVTGLAEEKPKSLRSDAAALILARVVNRNEYDIGEMKKEIHLLRNKLDEAKEKVATYSERINSLSGRLRDLLKERHIRNSIITIGSLLIPISYNIHKDNPLSSYVVGFLGLLLIFVGWLKYSGEEVDK